MTRCPCGTQHSGPRAPFDLAAELTTKMQAEAREPDLATGYRMLSVLLREVIAELRGLCPTCLFAAAQEMALVARAEVGNTAQAVASHARDLAARDFYSAVEPLTGDAALRTVHPRLRIVRESEGEPLDAWMARRHGR